MLIVEDHPQMRRTMRAFLQRAFPSCAIREAADGAGALEACGASQPILALIDKGLPDADGIELTARLKILYPGIQVVVVSSASPEIYAQTALAAGARQYVAKDALATDLIPAVAAAIGTPPAGGAGIS